MHTTKIILVTGLSLLSFCPVNADEDPVATLEKQLAQAWNKHKSFTADLVMTQQLDLGHTQVRSDSTGTVETLRQNDKTLVRIEQANEHHRKTGNTESSHRNTMTMIIDGEYAYVITTVNDKQTAQKTLIDPSMTGAPARLIQHLRQEYSLRPLPERAVNQRPALLIEATRTSPPSHPGMPSKVVCAFDQEHGVLLEMQTYTRTGELMSRMTYKNHKFDVDLNPRRFKFEEKGNIPLLDRTGTEEKRS